MSRRLLFVPLLAVFPGLVCAQEAKLVNCRTLESAGNFVGPDEVIVNDMVCQKAKAGAERSVVLPAPTPVMGAVISDTDSTSVVEAAKAASKRVSAAKEAIKERVEQTGQEALAPAAVPAETATPSAAPELAVNPAQATQSPEPAVPETKAEPVVPAKSPAPEVVIPAEPGQSPAAAALPVNAAPANANTQERAAVPANAADNRSAAPEQIKDPVAQDAVGSFVDAIAKATESRENEGAKPEKAESPAAPAPKEASVAPKATGAGSIAETPKPATEAPNQTPQPESSANPAASASGFYDANAGTNVIANPQPGDPAKAQTPAEPTAEQLAAKRAAEEAEAAMMAPDPNAPRERVVAMGAFAQPREAGPDPAEFAHKTTFQPGDIDGVDEGHRPECTKNITLGGLKGEKLVLGTPGWAIRWIEKNQKRMPQLCFSDTPMTHAKNYLVVFYTAPANADTMKPENTSATPQGAPAGGVGAFTLSYGSTWHYAQERNVGVTVLSRDEADQPQSDIGKIWYATAYTEEGVPVSENWPEKPKKPVMLDEKKVKSKKVKEARAELERVSDELFGHMVEDIAKL